MKDSYFKKPSQAPEPTAVLLVFQWQRCNLLERATSQNQKQRQRWRRLRDCFWTSNALREPRWPTLDLAGRGVDSEVSSLTVWLTSLASPLAAQQVRARVPWPELPE